jgi:hypothetical protein
LKSKVFIFGGNLAKPPKERSKWKKARGVFNLGGGDPPNLPNPPLLHKFPAASQIFLQVI